jgi:hypothetical protein
VSHPPPAELEKQLQAHLLGIGAIALEMHQSGHVDQAFLMRIAAQAADTERELKQAKDELRDASADA